MIRRPPRSTRTDTLFPYTTLFRSEPTRSRLAPYHSRCWCRRSRPNGNARSRGPSAEFAERLRRVVQRHLDRAFDPSRLARARWRSEEHTSELQSLMRISYAVFCLKKKNTFTNTDPNNKQHPDATPIEYTTNK